MATAGSGDVLTGIITGLICQGYSEIEAALAAKYLPVSLGNTRLRTETAGMVAAALLVFKN